MAHINQNYLKLQGSYLFSEIAGRIRRFQAENPDARLIRLGIGDVTRPLPAAVIQALHAATDEMGRAETFRGYGPEAGYPFLREAIAEGEYGARGVAISPDEIFVSDGAKCDTANIQEIFDPRCLVALTDPVYPVYVDSNVMAGRAGDAGADGHYDRLIYLPCTAENDFQPALPEPRVDLIYLCYPNNPTGAVITRTALARWVAYARANQSVILYDAAYAAYIRETELPQSIYEIDGAREVAIEFRSFSKSAGFTGMRCAFTVVPKEACGYDAGGAPVSLHGLWLRRQSTKFNGVPYVIQRAAAAVYTAEGRRQTREVIDYYVENARIIREGLTAAGLTVYGGRNAPYLWVKTPPGTGSWEFFDRLLREAHVVGTPGSGFGPSGEGYLRLTAFGSREEALEAVSRLGKLKIEY